MGISDMIVYFFYAVLYTDLQLLVSVTAGFCFP